MANFKYSYNEDDERPAEPVGEYKVKTALPNQVLVTAIVSYLFYLQPLPGETACTMPSLMRTDMGLTKAPSR